MAISDYLHTIHYTGLVHCDLHGGNIVLHNVITSYTNIYAILVSHDQ